MTMNSDAVISSSAEATYDRAVTLIQYYVQLVWFIVGAFLLAETVLLGAVASLIKEGTRVVVLSMSGFGLLLAVPWWTSYRYNHALLPPACGSSTGTRAKGWHILLDRGTLD